MIRYEVKTKNKSFAGCESTQKDAEKYIKSLIKAGVEILDVKYFDNDARIKDIQEGKA